MDLGCASLKFQNGFEMRTLDNKYNMVLTKIIFKDDSWSSNNKMKQAGKNQIDCNLAFEKVKDVAELDILSGAFFSRMISVSNWGWEYFTTFQNRFMTGGSCGEKQVY